MLLNKTRFYISGLKHCTLLNTATQFLILESCILFFILFSMYFTLFLPATPLCKHWWLDVLEKEVIMWNIMDLVRILSDDLVKNILCCKLIILFKNRIYVFLNSILNSFKMLRLIIAWASVSWTQRRYMTFSRKAVLCHTHLLSPKKSWVAVQMRGSARL